MKLVNEVRQGYDIVHMSTKLKSVEGRLEFSTHFLLVALDSQTQQGESDHAMQPIHSGTI